MSNHSWRSWELKHDHCLGPFFTPLPCLPLSAKTLHQHPFTLLIHLDIHSFNISSASDYMQNKTHMYSMVKTIRPSHMKSLVRIQAANVKWNRSVELTQRAMALEFSTALETSNRTDWLLPVASRRYNCVFSNESPLFHQSFPYFPITLYNWGCQK